MSRELSAEERGVIIDALIEHRASASRRAEVNPESTSDLRVEMCDDLILRLGDPNWDGVKDVTTQPCTHPLDQVTSTAVGDQLNVHCRACGGSWVDTDIPFELAIRLARATTDDFRGVFCNPNVTVPLARQVRKDLSS